METLVFETALGHIALARQATASEPLAIGAARLGVRSGSVRQEDRLLALTFGHASERAALKELQRMLAPTLARDTQTGTLETQTGDVYSNNVYRSRVDSGNNELVDRLSAFALGDAVSFADLDIDAGNLTPFGRQVTAACRQIAWGETLTYGELARRAGRPGAARAVGSVMARNRLPLIVPCHRVVAAAGGLGGYSAPQGVAMKQRLLKLEQWAVTLSE